MLVRHYSWIVSTVSAAAFKNGLCGLICTSGKTSVDCHKYSAALDTLLVVFGVPVVDVMITKHARDRPDRSSSSSADASGGRHCGGCDSSCRCYWRAIGAYHA